MLMCLCEGRRRKVKVRWKNLQSKHNHQYHRVILGNFFISFHRHFKPLQKPWTISLAQRWIREDRDRSKLIKNIYESQVDYCTTDIREVLSVVH